jgi:hypothetical protein
VRLEALPSTARSIALQQPSIVIALFLGGATLALVGALRLRSAGFRAMPRSVAVISVASGLAVVGFGVLFALLATDKDDAGSAMPRVSLAPVTSDDDAPASGTGVRGTVRSVSGSPVRNEDVVLVPLFEEKGVKKIRTTTDADGAFVFADVHVDPGSPWAVEVPYDGARFTSEVLRSPHGKTDPVGIVVAPTTKSAAAITVRTESLALVGDASGAQAVHALSVVNSSKRAYAGPVRLPLLDGALAIQEGAGLDRRYLDVVDGAMISSLPILPGRHDLTYTYIVQMSRRGIAIDREPTFATDRYELLVGGGLEAEPSAGLRDDGTAKIGPRGDQQTYDRFVARDVSSGARLRARVRVTTGSNALRTAAPIATGVIALVLIVIPLMLRRRRASRPADPAPLPTTSVV